jgi:DNA-binding beta-propeller fold protein YncE
MRSLSSIIAILVFATSCKKTEREAQTKAWEFSKVVQLDSVRPIGIAKNQKGYYVSDGDHNRVVLLDADLKLTPISIEGLERPMHIDVREKEGRTELLIPEYGRDSIAVYHNAITSYLEIPEKLDAPAGISSFEDELAIADFYNNRVLYFDGQGWYSIGTPGKAEGEFNYPTDVQLTADKIYVADAYNHRVQVFDKDGRFLQIIGQDAKMNASTGLHVSGNEIAITDFENDRILLFDLDGNQILILEQEVQKPTDVLIDGDRLLILNYSTGEVVEYQR